jgi:hypothetical protein
MVSSMDRDQRVRLMSDVHGHVCDVCTDAAAVRCSSHLRVWYGCRVHVHTIFTRRNHQLLGEQEQRDYERDQPEGT